MEFHLARLLGMTVGRLREEMTDGELVEWSAFLGLEAQHEELERQRWQR